MWNCLCCGEPGAGHVLNENGRIDKLCAECIRHWPPPCQKFSRRLSEMRTTSPEHRTDPATAGSGE